MSSTRKSKYTPTSQQDSFLLSLPLEILHVVLQNCDNSDLFKLVLVSTYLRDIVKQEIKTRGIGDVRLFAYGNTSGLFRGNSAWVWGKVLEESFYVPTKISDQSKLFIQKVKFHNDELYLTKNGEVFQKHTHNGSCELKNISKSLQLSKIVQIAATNKKSFFLGDNGILSSCSYDVSRHNLHVYSYPSP